MAARWTSCVTGSAATTNDVKEGLSKYCREQARSHHGFIVASKLAPTMA